MSAQHQQQWELQEDLIRRMCEACDRKDMPANMMNDLIAEAIGEIEMLRYDAMDAHKFRNERDSARREVCTMATSKRVTAYEAMRRANGQSMCDHGPHPTYMDASSIEYAKKRNWPCFPEATP